MSSPPSSEKNAALLRPTSGTQLAPTVGASSGAGGDAADRPDQARRHLTLLLQLAYSGELAATLAYLGHRHSLRDPSERADLGRIIREEIHHRNCLLDMLKGLDSGPDPYREKKMTRVGRTISAFCQVGGWFFPMYGAARLEAQNIREYELAARLAHIAGRPDWTETLLVMAEVEWDHEVCFRSKAQDHFLWRLMPHWPLPAPSRGHPRQLPSVLDQDERVGVPEHPHPLLVR